MKIEADVSEVDDAFLEGLDPSAIMEDIVEEMEYKTLEYYNYFNKGVFDGKVSWKVQRKKYPDGSWELVFRTDSLLWRVLDYGRDPYTADKLTIFYLLDSTRSGTFQWDTASSYTINWAARFVALPGTTIPPIAARGFSAMIGSRILKEFKNRGIRITYKLGGEMSHNNRLNDNQLDAIASFNVRQR